METVARRNLLKMLLGVGAAAACGLGVTGPTVAAGSQQTAAAPADGKATADIGRAGEAVESELKPDQIYFVRRRRIRRVYFVRRRRYRPVYVYRRPRRVIRYYRVRPRRRFRRVRFYF